jgi:Cu+-exporting ATPase
VATFQLSGGGRGGLVVSVFVGITGAVSLLALYLGLISLAQGPDHAIYQLWADLPFVLAIAIGFGIQVGLFVELRAIHSRNRASGALTATSAGAGGAAMLACCAHHLVDVLPLVGLSAATVFLADYRVPLLALSLGMNALGIAILGRQLVVARRRCGIPLASPGPAGA